MSTYGFLLIFAIFSVGCAQQENEPPPLPYTFAYAAGRAPGHIDRFHGETSDGNGIIQGQYSYVDPSYKVRTVAYVADKNGFHPTISHPAIPNQDTAAVAAAKQKHAALFNKIAQEQQILVAQRGQAGLDGGQFLGNEFYGDDGSYKGDITGSEIYTGQSIVDHPRDTPRVERAKLKHAKLYNAIAEQHQQIAAERDPKILAII